jgi:hypothetical protein
MDINPISTQEPSKFNPPISSSASPPLYMRYSNQDIYACLYLAGEQIDVKNMLAHGKVYCKISTRPFK